MKLHWETKILETRWAWRIARGAFSEIRYHYITLEHEGITGYGEAAHNGRYGETLETIGEFLAKAKRVLEAGNPCCYEPLIGKIHELAKGQHAAKAAIDMALHDWAAQRLGCPLHELWGLDPARIPLTSYSLGIDEEAVLVQKLAEAEPYPILKIKLGTPEDEAIVRTVRRHTDKVLRVDANEGWTDRELARDRVAMLEEMNVEFVEQPLPADQLDDVAWLRSESALPLVADEDVTAPASLKALAAAYDGVNLKVMKVGGLQRTLQMIHTARSLGLKVMLGCMIESSLGITAAAHLAPLVDWADLDGHLLLKDDPFQGVLATGGQLSLPGRPGIGVQAAAA